MTIYDRDGREIEKVELHKVPTRDDLHKLFAEKGFVKKSDKDVQRLMKEKEIKEEERESTRQKRVLEKRRKSREERSTKFRGSRKEMETNSKTAEDYDFSLTSEKLIMLQRVMVLLTVFVGVIMFFGFKKRRRRQQGLVMAPQKGSAALLAAA